MESVKLKVVTYNVLCSTDEAFSPRWELGRRRILAEQPDVIGFQETRPNQQKMIADSLPDYAVLGFGRDPDFGGESNCIAFRKEVFTLFGFHQCWLSPTPFVPGTRFPEQSPCPRVCVTVMLKHRALPLPIRFYNTHLDHVSEQARVLGMSQVLRRIQADNDDWALPYVLTGDMNARPDSQPIRDALAFSAYPMKDVSANLTDSFHSFGRVTGEKIDYIFTNTATDASPAVLWDDCENGVYISDHYPVAAELFFH